ncbi:MAG: ParB/Srx family N-terminal domain-containing protein, partial [Burkholderiaceae bacterium]
MPPRLPDAVEHLPLARLIPYVRNARTHDDDQVAKIAASIVEFGWLNPVLIDDACNVIAGHGRLLAAQKLGLPVIRAAHLTPAQVRAYRLLDNRLVELGGWNEELLAGELTAELDRLKEDGVDLDPLGFGQDELDRLLDGLDGGAGSDDDEDVVPEPPTEPDAPGRPL